MKRVFTPSHAGEGQGDFPGPGPVVMIDHHNLLPGTGGKGTISDRHTQTRPQQRGLDMTVPVAVMPGLLMGIFLNGYISSSGRPKLCRKVR
jgi:hypothetical protein